MKVGSAFWILLIVLLAGAVGLGYYLGTHGSDGRIADIRGEIARDSIRSDSVRAVLEDSLAALADSVDRVKVRVDTIVRVVRPAARRHAEEAAATLREHLTAKQDTIGLELYALEEAADEEVVLTYEREVTGLRAQLHVMDERLRLTEAVVEEQDSLIVRLRQNVAAMQAEAERWYRSAHPPLSVRILNDGWKFVAGATAGYLIGKA